MTRGYSSRGKARTHSEAADLQDIPNIGASIADDLRSLGIHRPVQLCGKDPRKLYDKLCRQTGQRHDPCVLDTFMAAVDFMSGAPAKPWWKYTDARKRMMNGGERR